jgi:endonuclease YncB( thermonuclease family)
MIRPLLAVAALNIEIMKSASDYGSCVVFTLAILSLMAGSAAADEPCRLTPLGSVHVAAVRDGRTLVLDDGHELRLAGIETNDDSKTVLRALAEGKTLQFGYLGASHDRYGRLFGFTFADGIQPSLQAALLEQGAARVSARVGDEKCAKALLAIESNARQARRGLWADPKFMVLQANDITKIGIEQGHFALVEGVVLSAHERGATTYLNFGRHWTHDFSVTIPRRLTRAFALAGVDLKALERHRIRVRGWIEQRRGPIIAVDVPEQIEIVN